MDDDAELLPFGLMALIAALLLYCFRTLAAVFRQQSRSGKVPAREAGRLANLLARAEARAEAGKAEAGLAELQAGLQRLRTRCDETALWWSPLVGRYQSELESYVCRHGLEPPREVVPAPTARPDGPDLVSTEPPPPGLPG